MMLSPLYYIWLVLVLWVFPPSRAGEATADDTDAGMFYSGLWVPDGDPNTFGHHDTWTNQTGASVSFDFIGIQIKVLATRRPVGTYLTNVSFSIDGGPPTLWTTQDFVPRITYQNLVYASGDLSPSQHELTIMNLGDIFWLDFVQYETADSLPVISDGGSTTEPFAHTTEASTLPPTTSRKSITTFKPHTTSDAAASGTGSFISPSGASITASGTAVELTIASAPSMSQILTTMATTALLSSSSDTGPAATGMASASSATSQPSSKTPIILGIVIGVVGALVLLFATVWWLRMRVKARESEALTATPYTAVHTPARSLSKGHPPPSPAVQTSYESSRTQLVSANDSDAFDGVSLPSSPDLSERLAYGIPQDADAARLFAKLRTDQASSLRASYANDRPLPYIPSAGPPMRSAPGRVDAIAPLSFATTLSAGFSSGVATSFYGPGTSSHADASESPLAGPHRTYVESRDGGVRLAGGPITDPDANMYTPAEYDEVVETLPPSYAQLSQGARLDER